MHGNLYRPDTDPPGPFPDPPNDKGAAPREATPLDMPGSPTWARTRDLRINSPALYQLSYRGNEARMICNERECVKDFLGAE